ncbi:putative effector protein, partial [Golovinomyces cichoracearum]
MVVDLEKKEIQHAPVASKNNNKSSCEEKHKMKEITLEVLDTFLKRIESDSKKAVFRPSIPFLKDVTETLDAVWALRRLGDEPAQRNTSLEDRMLSFETAVKKSLGLRPQEPVNTIATVADSKPSHASALSQGISKSAAPPTRDKKRGVSTTLDPKNRIQKPANNAGRAQPLAETLNRSVEKVITAAEEDAVSQDTQAVASSFEQPSGLTMEIDAESEDESTIEDFPPLPKIPSLKRSSESQDTVVDI